MNERLSRWVASVLAHRAGFVAFNLFTVAWFATPAVVAIFWTWKIGLMLELVFFLPGYLDIVTWFSGATQFTIAFQNDEARRADELQLRNQMHTMELLVALAKEIRGEQDENQQELLAQIKELAEDLDLEQLDKIGQIQALVEKVTPAPLVGEAAPEGAVSGEADTGGRGVLPEA